MVGGNARLYDLDPALVAAVIYQESKFHARRPQRRGRGRPDAAPARHRPRHRRPHGRRELHPATDLLDPELNVRYGCWYLRHLRQKYPTTRNGDELALAAYNAGQANVDSWIARTPAGQDVQIQNFLVCCKNVSAVHISRSAAKPSFLK